MALPRSAQRAAAVRPMSPPRSGSRVPARVELRVRPNPPAASGLPESGAPRAAATVSRHADAPMRGRSGTCRRTGAGRAGPLPPSAGRTDCDPAGRSAQQARVGGELPSLDVQPRILQGAQDQGEPLGLMVAGRHPLDQGKIRDRDGARGSYEHRAARGCRGRLNGGLDRKLGSGAGWGAADFAARPRRGGGCPATTRYRRGTPSGPALRREVPRGADTRPATALRNQKQAIRQRGQQHCREFGRAVFERIVFGRIPPPRPVVGPGRERQLGHRHALEQHPGIHRAVTGGPGRRTCVSGERLCS